MSSQASKKKKNEKKKKENFIAAKLKTFIKMDDYAELLREDVFGFIVNFKKIKNALDVGCAFGTSGRYLKAMGCEKVYGIDIRPDCIEIAKKYSDECLLCNIEEMEIPFEKKSLDYIAFSDVLEHLHEPTEMLKKFREHLKDDGFITVSLPNIRHYSIILRLILGQWEYSSLGILDKSHIRFFTMREMIKMFHEAGYEIENVRGGFFIGAMRQVLKLLFLGFPNSENIKKRQRKLKKYEDRPLRYKRLPKPILWAKLWLFKILGVHAYQYGFVLKKSNKIPVKK